MANLMNVNEILDFAIDSEQAAVDLYLSLAEKATKPAIKEALLEFADEERKHKKLLISVKEGNTLLNSDKEPVLDLQITDYTVSEEPEPGADYQSILLFAMAKEKAAFKLYTRLASETDNAELKKVLLGLAQEEAKHKLYFEMEYDEVILSEN